MPSESRQADASALAWLIGVRPQTVRMWAVRGLLTRAGSDHRGRTLYDVDAALECAASRGYRPERTCSVMGCDGRHEAKGYCGKHYARVKMHGSPDVVRPPSPDVGYDGVHHRLRKARGKASTHACHYCGDQASDWAYDHSDPDEKVNGRGSPYSTDLERYKPLCSTCHRYLDNRYATLRAG